MKFQMSVEFNAEGGATIDVDGDIVSLTAMQVMCCHLLRILYLRATVRRAILKSKKVS